MAIRVGLIGAGRSGRLQLDSLTSFSDIEVAAVCDNDRALAESVAAPYGAKVHISFRTLLESERLDALFVCLPPFARGEAECAAARAGIHLLLDHPVALSVEKARQIQKEIETSGVVAAVAAPWRYLSGVAKAKEILGDRRIAMIRGIRQGSPPPEGWRRRSESSGGRFLQEAADLLDLARYFGGEVMSVSAVEFQGLLAQRLPEYDIEDAVAALFRFQSGAVAEIVSNDLALEEECALHVLADSLRVTITANELIVVEPGRRHEIAHDEPGLCACQRAFLEAVKSGNAKSVKSSYADAVRVLEVSLAAKQAARSGRVLDV
jgi:predicted dehydrogenase